MPVNESAGGVPAVAQGSFVDTVFSADGSLLYAATANGVRVINVATGQVINTFIPTIAAGGMDISPDGLYLAVVDTHATSGGVLYRIRLSDGNAVAYSVSGTQALNDVAYLSDGRMVISQQVAAPLHIFNPVDGTSYDIGRTLPAYSVLTESANLVLAQPHTITWPLYTQDYRGGGFLSSYLEPHDPYAGASVSPPDQAVGAVSPTGNLVVQGSSLSVYDSSLHLVTSLGDKFPYLRMSYGVKFSADGKSLYVATRDGQIVQFDTSTWDVVAAYELGASPAYPGTDPGPTVGYGNVLQLSPDGHRLSVITEGGIQLIDLSLSAPSATPEANTLSGPGPLYGFGGNDDLTGTGSTSMYGGSGNDTYHVTGAGDQVVEIAGQGEDTVHASISYVLAGNVENLFLDGSGAIDGRGNDLNNSIIGNAAANKLSGGAGNDNVQAGSGDDTLDGGAGDDVLDGGDGTDTVTYQDYWTSPWDGVTVSLAIKGPQNTGPMGKDTLISIENLIGSFNNDHLTGNSEANRIDGRAGDDFISGGLGADTLTGGDGYDTFIDTAAGLNGDTITDYAAGDKIVITDANLSSFTYSLSNGVLTYSGGTLNVGTAVTGLAVSAAAQGGVQLTIVPAGVVSTDTIAGQLTNGYWDGDVRHFAVTQGGTITVNIATLSPEAQTLARAALATWTDIIGVHFQEVLNGEQISFSDDKELGGGRAAYTTTIASDGIISQSSIKITNSWLTAYGTGLQTYSFQTYIHEIGHALGLGHAGDYNVDAAYPTDALFKNDGWPLTIMSYFSQDMNTYFGNELHFSQHYVSTPMQADILAMQSLYGLSSTTRTGDTIYGFHSNAGSLYDATVHVGAFTIYDSGGKDTLDYSGYGGFQQIDLNGESFSSVGGLTNNLAIARGVVVENAIGGSGFDIIIGNAAANAISSGLGSDLLTGGAGNDTFSDTAASHNGDTISDFSVGDRIIFSDAALGSFAYSLSGNTLNFTGGSLTLGAGVPGALTASAAAGGGVQLTFIKPDVRNDFNGDGHSDVLLQNANGSITNWLGQADGTFFSNHNAASYALPSGWDVAGTGDINGDERTDVILRNANGSITEWLGTANGGFSWNAAATYGLDSAWRVAGIGDFNGDGYDDLLLRHDNGSVTDWLGQADGTFFSNHAAASYALPAGWDVARIGDFNGDHRADVILRNADGSITEWLGTATGGFGWNAAATYALDAAWHVAGAGDFNGDGLDDLLLRHDNGSVTDWLGQADGTFFSNHSAASYALPASWDIVQTGDFDGDHRTDVLLRNANGSITEWLATANGGFSWNAAATYGIDPAWDVQPSLHLFA